MPRIAAALTIVAAAAFSIGLNIVRYPIVWEKLAARQDASPAAAAGPPAAPGDFPESAAWSDSSDYAAGETEDTGPKRVTASISGGSGRGSSKSRQHDDSTSRNWNDSDSYSYDSQSYDSSSYDSSSYDSSSYDSSSYDSSSYDSSSYDSSSYDSSSYDSSSYDSSSYDSSSYDSSSYDSSSYDSSSYDSSSYDSSSYDYSSSYDDSSSYGEPEKDAGRSRSQFPTASSRGPQAASRQGKKPKEAADAAAKSARPGYSDEEAGGTSSGGYGSNYRSNDNEDDGEDSYRGWGSNGGFAASDSYSDTESSRADSSGDRADLVPVGRAYGKSGLAATGAGMKNGQRERSERDEETDGTVRRLPSVDTWTPNPHADDRRWSGGTVASYPSTGVE